MHKMKKARLISVVAFAMVLTIALYMLNKRWNPKIENYREGSNPKLEGYKRFCIFFHHLILSNYIAFSGVALASLPVCPTPETEGIKTVTQISCEGMVTEEERVSWESSNEDIINNPPLDGNETVGMLNYKQDLKVTDGMTRFVKDLDVDTGTAPNLNVMKSMGYAQGVTIGALSHDEEVSMSLVSNYTATSGVVLCPFAAAAVEVLPASCEDVKASSM